MPSSKQQKMQAKYLRRKSASDIIAQAEHHSGSMKKSLGLYDLTGMGIAAIIGAGIFSTIGNAAQNGGPAVSLLFVFTAFACGFSAFCYARFASVLPISGSAYTYAYVSFGEIVAWIIGWDLIMEYAVGNIAVAISWSDYFTSLMNGLGMHIPDYLCIDYISSSRGYTQVVAQLGNGTRWADIALPLQEAFTAWTTAPQIGNLKLICDAPAFSITCAITWLVYIGIHESKTVGNIMVLLKLVILLLVIGVGAFYVNPHNWSPFAPNGMGGVLKGISGVFFAYIGFDAISTTAEECKNPQQDLPKAMIYSLLVTTILYITISLILTGMVSYKELGSGDPLAFVFQKLHLNWISGVIALSAIIAMASVLLVFQIGQPRIWMSMSRDGLLPEIFGKLHPKYQTPWFSTIVTGIVVALPSLFMNLTEVTDLTSIGTLFAFMLVSAGVLILDYKKKGGHPIKQQFYIPYINSRYYLLPLWLIILGYTYYANKETTFFHDISIRYLTRNIPLLIFSIISIATTIFAIIYQFSIIPVLGLLTNMYLMTELGSTNWLRFSIWLSIGLVVYFTYGAKQSKLGKKRIDIVQSQEK